MELMESLEDRFGVGFSERTHLRYEHGSEPAGQAHTMKI